MGGVYIELLLYDIDVCARCVMLHVHSIGALEMTFMSVAYNIHSHRAFHSRKLVNAGYHPILSSHSTVYLKAWISIWAPYTHHNDVHLETCANSWTFCLAESRGHPSFQINVVVVSVRPPYGIPML